MLGFGWLGVLGFMKRFLDKTWDMCIKRAVSIIPLKLDVHVESTLPVNYDVVLFLKSFYQMVSVSIAFYLDAKIVHY